jgi:tetratricopeptide (TPR) repeat protein
MKKYFMIMLLLASIVAPFLIFHDNKPAIMNQTLLAPAEDLNAYNTNLLNYLKTRQDNLALEQAQKILSLEPNDLSALWAKAEILRRNYDLKTSEELLNRILNQNPDHIPSLISLSYINYYNNRFSPALKLLKQVLNYPNASKENQAMAYMLIGSINAKRASATKFLGKIAYGMRIKNYFEKALGLAPELPEVHLGLGSFYLLAPSFAGGNVDKAIEELETAVKLAPDFATANARLAQAYKKKGNLEEYSFFIQRAKELDPGNQALKEAE